MSGKYEVTANLTTVVAVRNTDSEVNSGKWSTQPGGTVDVGEAIIFVATNRDSDPAGPDGFASYVAADGTEFKFEFDDPWSKANSCTASMSNVSGPWVLPTPDYPQDGKVWDVDYAITTSAAFFDAPVFGEAVLAAAKCTDYDDARVKRWIDGRDCVRMADVMVLDDLPALGKLWCATHRLFLTPSSKALLTRDLAQVAARELGDGGLSDRLLDEALQANADAAAGRASPERLAGCRARLGERAAHVRPTNERHAELLDAVASLAHRDPARGWANAASSYCGAAVDEDWTARAEAVLRLVEQRL